ncbi:MAG TPA: hypothetical protein VL242_00760, partial [Sorangium sp.]|nr:hypothetical protein [Sorangium sp.]
VGAGDGTDSANRQITFFAEGGSKFTGKVEVNGTLRSTMWKVTQVFKQQPGPLPLSGTFSSGGGTLIMMVSGSARNSGAGRQMGMSIALDGSPVGFLTCGVTASDAHRTFIPDWLVLPGIASGNHTIQLASFGASVVTDGGDVYSVTVLELPF